MLFNSYEFIFLFLVPFILLYKIIPPRYTLWYFIVGSIVFYTQWDWIHLALLLGSVVVNYFYAKYVIALWRVKVTLWGIVLINLIPLGYFKYSNFLNFSEHNLILHLAISFFTFQQIAYAVDVYKGHIKVESFERYGFFILFFPQLIAGPIVHYRELMGQVCSDRLHHFNEAFFKEGVMLFCIGLFKKVVLADSLAPIANKSFLEVTDLSSYDAWLGIFAYSFQIYFDFSGYADMAIGLALMFGLRLPLNFHNW